MEKAGKGSSVVGGASAVAVSGRAVEGEGGSGVPGVSGVRGCEGEGGGSSSSFGLLMRPSGKSKRAEFGGECVETTRLRCDGERERDRREEV